MSDAEMAAIGATSLGRIGIALAHVLFARRQFDVLDSCFKSTNGPEGARHSACSLLTTTMDTYLSGLPRNRWHWDLMRRMNAGEESPDGAREVPLHVRVSVTPDAVAAMEETATRLSAMWAFAPLPGQAWTDDGLLFLTELDRWYVLLALGWRMLEYAEVVDEAVREWTFLRDLEALLETCAPLFRVAHSPAALRDAERTARHDRRWTSQRLAIAEIDAPDARTGAFRHRPLQVAIAGLRANGGPHRTGYTCRQIAAILGVDEEHVKNHLRSFRKALDCCTHATDCGCAAVSTLLKQRGESHNSAVVRRRGGRRSVPFERVVG